MNKIYDILIIGGGVAGMTASVYAKRRGKKVAIIEKYTLGGQVASLNRIENFPSQENIDGFSLSQMFAKQVKHLEIDVISDDVVGVDFSKDMKEIVCKKETYQSKSVIIASGMSYNELGKNENEFLGRGVSYCAVCDANFYKHKPVCVASKKGSGIKSALELSNVCSKVVVLDSEDMSVYAKVNKNPTIDIVSKVDIEKLEGDLSLTRIQTKTNGVSKIYETSALFVDLGKTPSTSLYKDKLEMDAKGFIKTDENMCTSTNGVFAVGDVRNGFLKQIVTACSDGAIAGQLA